MNRIKLTGVFYIRLAVVDVTAELFQTVFESSLVTDSPVDHYIVGRILIHPTHYHLDITAAGGKNGTNVDIDSHLIRLPEP